MNPPAAPAGTIVSPHIFAKSEPIAIIGRSALLPGAASPEAFADNLKQQKVSLSLPPDGRWRSTLDFVDPSGVDSTWSAVGGYVTDNVDSPWPSLDPLFSWTYATAKKAIDDAHLTNDLLKRTILIMGNLSFPTSKMSAFAESTWCKNALSLYRQRRFCDLNQIEQVDPRNYFMSGLPALMTARDLGLHFGFALDAACASSLYAIRHACDRLQTYTADAVVVGAVNAADSLFIHVGFCALQAMSRTGQSRPFHADADGLVPSEGAAFFVLKRLSDAVLNGDHIYGVIRSVGLSNDGRSGGFLAPSLDGEKRAIEAAYRRAGLVPSDVPFVECHATGTKLGDSIELHAMRDLWGRSLPVVGSHKGNIGHSITVAGAAGLLKVLASFENDQILPSVPNDDPVDSLDGFEFPNTPIPWPDERRRAAVSAFGFGGNNAHLIVESFDYYKETNAHLSIANHDSKKENVNKNIDLEVMSVEVVSGKQGDDSFLKQWFTGELYRKIESVEVELADLNSPPKDLESANGQQLLIVSVVQRLLKKLAEELRVKLASQTVSVLVSMATEATVARYGARWRSFGWKFDENDEKSDIWKRFHAELADAFIPQLRAEGVIGNMPNIVANRINHQYDFSGPSFTISAEEGGASALFDTARLILAAGDAEFVIAAGVDHASNIVHDDAAISIGGRKGGDVAVAMLLRLPPGEEEKHHENQVVTEIAPIAKIVKRRDFDNVDRHLIKALPFDAPGSGSFLRVAAGVFEVVYAANRCLDPVEILPMPQPWVSLPHSELCVNGAPRCAVIPMETALAGTRTGVVVESCQPPKPLRFDAMSRRVIVMKGESRDEILERLGRLPEDVASGEKAIGSNDLEVVSSGSGLARLAILLLNDKLPPKLADSLRRGLSETSRFCFRDKPLVDVTTRRVATDSGTKDSRMPEMAFVFTGSAGAYKEMASSLFLGLPETYQKVVQRCFVKRDGDTEKLDEAAWSRRAEILRRGCIDPIFCCKKSDAKAGKNQGDSFTAVEQILAGSFVAQAHAYVSQQLLKLRPGAAIGYSLGETNMLFALGAWDDLGKMMEDVVESPIFNDELSNEHDAVARYWNSVWDGEGVDVRSVSWCNWSVIGDVAEVERRVEEDAVKRRGNGDARRSYVTMINTDQECVLSGPPDVCDELLAQILNKPNAFATPVETDVAIHAPVATAVAQEYRELHHRRTVPIEGVTFYSNAGGAYEVSSDACAEHILSQAVNRIDFRQTIEKAYEDGVRIFVEHGPKSLCSNWIDRILEERDHVAVSLDRRGMNDIDTIFMAVLKLLAAGVDIDTRALEESVNGDLPKGEPVEEEGKRHLRKRFKIGREDFSLPIPPGYKVMLEPEQLISHDNDKEAWKLEEKKSVWVMPKVASLYTNLFSVGVSREGKSGVLSEDSPKKDAIKISEENRFEEPFKVNQRFGSFEGNKEIRSIEWSQTYSNEQSFMVNNLVSALSSAHEKFIHNQTYFHNRYIELESRWLEGMARGDFGKVKIGSQEAIIGNSRNESVVKVRRYDESEPTELEKRSEEERDVLFNRADLIGLAKGKVSTYFGPKFILQDQKRIQCRMPEPPLLLADRVMEIDAERGSLRPGTIWTETDVKSRSEEEGWYEFCGRMPAGVTIESGQADLLLVSWLGIDLQVEDGRAYRLLGCELTYHGDLAAVGDTLRYEIKIDSFATHAGVRLFFFHYDCTCFKGGDRTKGRPLLSVRNGQAGFFTREELDDSKGVLWSPEDAETDPNARCDKPIAVPEKRSFSTEELQSLSYGAVRRVFGEAFAFTSSHVRTPTIDSGRMLFLDRIEVLDFDGGPYRSTAKRGGLGYLRAVQDLRRDAWFFDGHFHNDPCMPGTLMFEGTLQTMAFYMMASGVTIKRDGWRFQPMVGSNYKMSCRGQATPESTECVYELFVRAFCNGADGENPNLFGDLLVTIDGRKAFYCENMGLELVPDYPLTSGTQLLDRWYQKPQNKQSRFDYPALLATAWGSPVEAFGEMYRSVEGTSFRIPRLPGPPYHFMTRVVEEEGHLSQARGRAVVEYELPSVDDELGEGWYYEAHVGSGTMPFAVLLEVALQPCGWLATWVGGGLSSNLKPEKPLFFRNLDGNATLHRHLRFSHRTTLVVETVLTRFARSGGMTLVNFDVKVRDVEGTLFYSCTTGFGFFPEEALASQAGIPELPGERTAVEAPPYGLKKLRSRDVEIRGRWEFLDSLDFRQLQRRGEAEVWRIRGSFDIDPENWFFKAHFYGDPVQPGSIGLETILSAVRIWSENQGLNDTDEYYHLKEGTPHQWKYRGQVRPHNHLGVVLVDVSIGDGTSPDLQIDASLWVDNEKIYTMSGTLAVVKKLIYDD